LEPEDKKMALTDTSIIDEREIEQALASPGDPDAAHVREVLAKAGELRGLSFEDITVLMNAGDPALLSEIYAAARRVKEEIYGSRLVLFAPLYISNYCKNDCTYCAFRADNREVKRRALTQEEIAGEVRVLIGQGHKRVLMVAGEACPDRQGLRYVLDAIATIYGTRCGNGEIRRVNVNLAPLPTEGFADLKAADIGTYQLFQETYHRPTYAAVHRRGPKADFDWRATAMHRAMEAGIDDVGVGVLFGLYDWRFEVLALMQHIRSLEQAYGVGPHTISVPRLEPAIGSPFSTQSPYLVSDADFMKLIAILRLAVPYTGMIMSTRENPAVRRETFKLGISQISGGSRCDPGGYSQGEGGHNLEQFQLGDHRPLDEVIRDISELGFMPSFCTACYRLGRTGRDFMDLAKPGDIKDHCEPNALSTFQEYLIDYASPETRAAGERLVQITLDGMEGGRHLLSGTMLDEVKSGKRDVFV
jgi:2-iminoacetate synthase